MQQNTAETNKRMLRVTPFVLALLCFVLPFVQFSCRGQKVVSLTGIQLVTGTEISQKDPFSGQTKTQKLPSDKWVVFALVCTAAAGGLCFVSGTAGKLLPTVLGAAGFVWMLVFKKQSDDALLKDGQGILTIEYLLGFIAMCIFLLVGAGLSGYHYSQARKRGTVEAIPKPVAKVDA